MLKIDFLRHLLEAWKSDNQYYAFEKDPVIAHTLPIDKISSVKNMWAWVSMVSYLKNKWKLKY